MFLARLCTSSMSDPHRCFIQFLRVDFSLFTISLKCAIVITREIRGRVKAVKCRHLAVASSVWSFLTVFSTLRHLSRHFRWSRRIIKCKWDDVDVREMFSDGQLDEKTWRVSANETKGHFSTFSWSSALSRRVNLVSCQNLHLSTTCEIHPTEIDFLHVIHDHRRFWRMFDVSFSLLSRVAYNM